jgi:exopolysaccharide biosynthesis WecB/TagA/CpsF family protein
MEKAVPASEFLGLRFDLLTVDEAIVALAELGGRSQFSYVVTPNVDHVVQLHRRDSGDALWASYRAASLSLCDSRVLQLLARWCGQKLEVSPGSDLTALLLKSPSPWLESIAVIGGDAQMMERLRSLRPDLRWFHHEPPMGVRTDAAAQNAIIDFVEASAGSVAFFAIGAPQSELLCHSIAQRGKASGIGLCIGASLEFVTGRKRRAPYWVQRLRLEWLFRLITEPRRLARRYLVDGPHVIKICVRWLQGRRRAAESSGSTSLGER